MDFPQQLDLSLRIIVAAVLAGIIGYNREQEEHPGGLRTHILIGLGSALFTGISAYAFQQGDPGRIASQIVVGVGFIGAGTIIQGRSAKRIYGLTTAAGIWVVSAVGMACGSGNYVVAIVTTILIWVVMVGLKRWERDEKTPPKDKDATDGDARPAGPPRIYTTSRLRDRSPKNE